MYDTSSNLFYIANTGDTRAVLSRNGKAQDLSYDRKGNDPEEIARVVKAGGFVSKGRIMGSLAVSRALGKCCMCSAALRPIYCFIIGVIVLFIY